MNLTKVKIGRASLITSGAALAIALAALQAWAQEAAAAEAADVPSVQLAQSESGSEAEAQADEGDQEELPEISEEALEDPEVIAAGEAVWQEQCRHCHGRSAYPGKAPRLRPSRYTPEFVYHRVTYGFRGMPAWEDVYSEEERIAVTAYVLSREFSP